MKGGSLGGVLRMVPSPPVWAGFSLTSTLPISPPAPVIGPQIE